ncbi:MAG: hypothetical protein AAGF53_07445 [Pseudomonadota bacterium]
MPKKRQNSDGADAMKELQQLAERIAQNKVPTLSADAIDPSAIGAPAEWHAMIRYLRTAPFLHIKGCVGAGIGLREVKGEQTDEEVVVALVSKKRPTSKLASDQHIPAEIEFDGAKIPIDVQEAGFDPIPKFTGASTGAYPRATGSCSGSGLSLLNPADPCIGGTLTGIFGGRAMTAAHVTLGFGFEEFFRNLPLSLLWLFRSPNGVDVIASDTIQRGQGLHRLFEVDTQWPILAPMPLPVFGAGALGFIFVDGAAGDAQPIAIPPFAQTAATPPFSYAAPPPQLAPDRSNRFGGTIQPARIARPGERCFKDGQTSGLTFGTVWLPFFQIYLPIPLGFMPAVVLFDTVLCRLVIAPGDSGCAVLSEDLDYLAQGSLGLGSPQPGPPPPPLPAGTPPPLCPIENDDLLQLTLATPYYWQELFLGMNLS